MQATTTLYLANGLTRIVQGRAEDIGNTLKTRTMGQDDRIRQYLTPEGETLTIRADAIIMTEAAEERTEEAFGFAQALA